ncbi:MAG: DUF2961 domain-containing protein [Candidatus Latescibacterota bacterium]|jgi:hypothetical protein
MKDLSWFLHRLHDFAFLTEPDREGRTVMASSLNQRMGPRDCNFSEREEIEDGRRWRVLVDWQGPGCLTRFWTAGDFDGDLEIWLDGQRWLRTTLRVLFGGALFPFIKPLVLDCPDSSQGRVSYLPIPFARSCRVRVASDTGSFYWQLNALRYPEGMPVHRVPDRWSGEEEAALARVRERWAQVRVVEDRSPDPCPRVVVPATGSASVWEAVGPGQVQRLSFDLGDGQVLATLALQAWWDGADEPAVAVPLRLLFCQATRPRDFASLFVSRRGSRATCSFPMPYAAGARLALVNPTRQDLEIGCRVDATPAPCTTDLRFHCKTGHERFGYGSINPLLRVNGTGRFAGLYLVTEQVGVSHYACFNQEGNEYFYVDGEQDPSWLGTGTEDYFNCAYYYARGEVDTPTHGCLDVRLSETGLDQRGLVAAYRFHLLDSVPFTRSLLFLLEAGCPRKGALAGVNGQEQVVYQWACFWYQAGAAEATPRPAVGA